MVGGWRLTVAFGMAAVAAVVGKAGLVDSGGVVDAPIGFVDVASLMVGAGAVGRSDLIVPGGTGGAFEAAGLVMTGVAGLGGTGAAGAVAFGASPV